MSRTPDVTSRRTTVRARTTPWRRVQLDDALLRVVADPVRARILELLAAEELCTCHLVDELGITQSGVSNHLRVLREAGLVEAEPCGRFTYYRLRSDVLRRLGAQLARLAESAPVRRPC
ncbi:MAG TPA: metalloregulator ArsR/SmtB family transcription factor [Mycobacteriales bacterium]|nr:metalloregulator ArsR/SmtB family transcription factor [Mycobacteriales bacterium]